MKTRSVLRLFVAVLAALLWASAPAGAVVQKLGYQGTLRQAGTPLSGSHALVFRVYGQLTGGAALWTSPAMSVNFTSGRFFALLEPTGFDWEGTTPYLELEVDGTILAPREELTASAYALNAWQLSGKKYTSSAAAPASPGTGDLWYDTAEGILKFYAGASWTPTAGPAFARLASTQTFSGQNAFLNRVTVSTELFLSDGFITFANGSAPPPARGRVYFDPSGQGAFKVSLDGTSWVALSTGSAGGIAFVTASAAQFSGDGTPSSPLALAASSVTLQGNVFNAAGRLVRLDVSGRYPALDGSQIQNLPADTAKLAKAGDAMTGDLQVGQATASTFSAAGYMTLAGLGSAPPGAAGRVYFDSGSGKLRLHTGASFMDVATGTILSGTEGTALLGADQSFTGSNSFQRQVLLSTPTLATSGTPGVDSPQVVLRGQAWDSLSLTSTQRQINLRTRVTNENTWRLAVDRGGSDLWSVDQAGNVASGSSVTASGFFGSGAGLTGIGDASITGLSAAKLTGAVPAAGLGNAVLKSGDAMSGQLTLGGSTLTVTGQDASGYSLKLSSGLSMPAGTVTAGLFVGNGAGLTNVPASQVGAANVQPGPLGAGVIASSIAVAAVLDPSIVSVSASKLTGSVPAASLGNAVLKAGDAMSGQLTLSGSTLTVAGQDASGYSLKLSSGLSMPAGTVAAGLFVGSGAGLSNVPAAQVPAAGVQAGALGAGVIASSVAVGAVLDASIVSVSASKLAGNVPAGNLGNAVLKAGDSVSGTLNLEGAGTHLGTLTRPAVAVGTHVHVTAGNLGVGNSDPGERLDVSGAIVLRQTALPALPAAGRSKLVMDSGSGKVKLSENGGPFVNLIGGAGGAVTLQSTTPGIADTGHLNLSGTGLLSAVGVGVTAPTARIEARGNAADSYTLRLGTGAASYQVVATTMGALGLGTPAPQASLDLYGYAGQDLARLHDPYAPAGYLAAGYTGQDAGFLTAYRAGYRPLRISGSPVTFPDGKVGIGTSVPAARLQVSEPAAVPGDTVLAVSTGAAAGSEVLTVKGDGKTSVIATGAAGESLFSVSTGAAAGSEFLVVKGDGRLGLGVSSPAHPLHVASYSLGRPSILIDNRSAATSTSGALRFAKNASDKWAILTDASQANVQDLAFYDSVAGAYRLYISSEGNVSIDGPTAPQGKLDVNGTVLIRGLPPTPPVAPAGHSKLWYDSSTNKLRLSENGGAYTAVVGGVANAVTLQPTTPGAADAGHFNVQGHGIVQQGLEVSSGAASAALDTVFKVSTGAAAGQTALIVKGSGDVGLGLALPGYRLDVAGTVRVKSDTNSGDALIVGNDSKLADVDVANTLGLYGLQDAAQGHLRLGSAGPTLSGLGGNLGIGVAAPPDRLSVDGGRVRIGSSLWLTSGTWAAPATPDTVSQGERLVFYQGGGWKTAIGMDPANGIWTQAHVAATAPGFQVYTGANAAAPSAKLTVRGDGNVGIGTTAPARPLDVAGHARVTGGLASPPAFDTDYPAGHLTLRSPGHMFLAAGSGFNNHLTANLYYDGVNWNRLNTANAGGYWWVGSDGRGTFSNAAAGANPAAVTVRLEVTAAGDLLLAGQPVNSNFKYVTGFSDWRNNSTTCAQDAWCSPTTRTLSYNKTRASSLVRLTYQDTLGTYGTNYGACTWRILVDGVQVLLFSAADNQSSAYTATTYWRMQNANHQAIATGLGVGAHTIQVQTLRNANATECLMGWNQAGGFLSAEEVGP